MWIGVRIPQKPSTRKFNKSDVEAVLKLRFSAVNVSNVDQFDRRVEIAKELFSNNPSPSEQSVLRRTIVEKELLGPAYIFNVSTTENVEFEGGMKSYSVWFHSEKKVTSEQEKYLINVLTEIASDRPEFHLF